MADEMCHGGRELPRLTIVTALMPPKNRLWLKVLVTGLLLWVLTVAVLWTTEVTALIPVVIFVGSFLTPVVFAVWVFEREEYSGVTPDGRDSVLSVQRLVSAFAVGGLLGVTLAALLETLMLNHIPVILWLPGVAVIEETIKIAIVWWLARSLTTYYLRDGMVLGACVGFGFAAFETSGYAFNALILTNETDILPVLETQLVRGMLTPVGHGLWTALLAGALFAAASKTGKLHVAWSVAGWWLTVVLLHWIWDASSGLAAVLTQITSGEPATVNAFETGKMPSPTDAQVHLLAFYSWVLLTVCALIGIWLANRMWSKGRAVVPGYPHGPAVDESIAEVSDPKP